MYLGIHVRTTDHTHYYNLLKSIKYSVNIVMTAKIIDKFITLAQNVKTRTK